ncbi:hypothetical protein CVT26_008194 [Gymnopilus dilepis]|uniref:Uncharacterized protein n=1 Tax=Gymnopilus dilepis TaxID=231916 RepID=A0A409XX74_9AGAR|nr:hypothetical protein CVT26_008194 [Gymnopilus dilepis]
MKRRSKRVKVQREKPLTNSPVLPIQPPCHISSLPVEILATILEILVEDRIYFVSWKNGIESRESILKDQLDAALDFRRASEVCRFWRQTAFTCKRAWGTILHVDFSGSQWVEELLRRSHPAPLIVHSVYYAGDPHDRFRSQKWTMILEQSYRFKELKILCSRNDDMDPVMQVLENPAPLLEGLYIEAELKPIRGYEDDYSDYEEDDDDGHYYHVGGNDALFRNAPNLQSLTLQRLGCPETVKISPCRLRSLDVALDENMPFHVPISNWLDLLADLPLLEVFSFFSHMLPLDSSERPSNREVDVRRLRSFHLHCHISDCSLLLENLLISPTCHVHLHVHPTAPSADMTGFLRGVNKFIRTWVFRPEEHVFWKIETRDLESFSFEIHADPTLPDSRAARPSLMLCLDYDIRSDLDINDETTYLPSILDNFRKLPLVKHNTWLSLDLEGPNHGELERHFLPFFKSFKAVKKLIVAARSHPEFDVFSSLLMAPYAGIDTLMFPDLNTVIYKSECGRGHGPDTTKFQMYASWREAVGKPVPQVESWCWEDIPLSLRDSFEIDCWTGEV